MAMLAQAIWAKSLLRHARAPPHSRKADCASTREAAGLAGGAQRSLPKAVDCCATPRPNFSGEWNLERTENQKAFLLSIDYNSFMANSAFLARVKQTVEQRMDEFQVVMETFPPLAPTRCAKFHVGADEVRMRDDAGREMLFARPAWRGDVLAGHLRYLNPAHELTIERYMEGGRMVEHVRYPSKHVEMRRIFKKSA
mmetsp:Transcript_73509/g.206398  ORF Transcript_73509/g.206398 Transcript_73509/m.206398 type:complete len:197 (+) Transcript_73509:47-637(+)